MSVQRRLLSTLQPLHTPVCSTCTRASTVLLRWRPEHLLLPRGGSAHVNSARFAHQGSSLRSRFSRVEEETEPAYAMTTSIRSEAAAAASVETASAPERLIEASSKAEEPQEKLKGGKITARKRKPKATEPASYGHVMSQPTVPTELEDADLLAFMGMTSPNAPAVPNEATSQNSVVPCSSPEELTAEAAAMEKAVQPPMQQMLLELLPPRPTPKTRQSLPKIPYAAAGGDSAPTRSPMAPAPPRTEEAYAGLFRDSFVNPFNGRLIASSSPTASKLFRLGFFRSMINPLHLEWSPADFMVALQSTMQTIQNGRHRRHLRSKRAAAKHQGRNTVSEGLQKEQGEVTATEMLEGVEGGAEEGTATVDTEKGVSDAQTQPHHQQQQQPPSALMEQGDKAIMTLELNEFVAEARARLLRPLRHRDRGHWMNTLADIMERKDVFTFLNRELERLYSELIAAYLPPKLDTPIDVTLADMELTKDQMCVLQLALRGLGLYIGGSAGTGKTVLLKSIFRELTLMGLRVAVTATTGVAAVQLGGCTFHRAFDAPVDATSRRRWDANALRAVDTVIVDEVSLLDANMFDAFDMEARLARMSNAPFGGLQVIICGDFLQLSHDETLPAYESAAFRYLMAVRLVTPMRHRADDPLLALLEEIRHGEFNAEQFRALDREIPPDTTHITYIFPRRREAQQLNDEKLSELQSQEMTFTPQRGPLQLCGTFTSSALIEVPRDEHGMRRPLPDRERLLAILNEEAHRTCHGWAGASALSQTRLISDHEMVMMPVRAETAFSTRFILRVRFREATMSAGSESDGSTSDPTAAQSVTTIGRGESSADQATPTPRKRTLRTTTPFSEAEWESVSASVAARLGGRLVTMMTTEPASLVPLSVSMTLADMTSPDVAHSLSPLRLKLGCRVMINRNLSRTVSNGSVGMVEAFAPPDLSLFPRRADRSVRSTYNRITQSKLFEYLPVVRLLSGEVVQVPPVALLIGGTPQSYYYGHEVLTLPLQLGYAFTVHKVQGLTLHGAVVLDCKMFFDCPHLIYVACSRVRRMDQLIVRNVEARMIIVQRRSLEFSESLPEASTVNTFSMSDSAVRAAWAVRSTQRILPLSE